jgi:hypothetical protein
VYSQLTHQVISYLFKKILRVLAEGDPLNGTGPTIFLVYAHDSKVGEARAEVSEQLITWLKVVRANLRSDKSPLGPGLGTGTNLDSNDNAAHNILWNQFCLLPPSSYEKSVDKVILCCSEALWNYYQTSLVDSSLQGFPDAVKAAHLSCPKTPKNPAKLHSAIELVVEKHMEDPEFHHVLTELVFLDIRKENRKETDVIPVILNLKPDTYKEIPGFVEGTELWINFESSTTINPDSCRPLHHLFFKLLGRLLPQDDRSVRGFRAVYKDCTRWLDKRTAEESLWSKKRLRRKFKEYVISRIRIVSQTLINDMSAFARTHKTKG